LFTTPIDEITAEQVEGLIGQQETQTVEFKQDLSVRTDGADEWVVPNGKVSTYARDKLLKEVVAFANTSGGHLILGVKEDPGPPPCASAINPIPRCVDLAARLSQAAQTIEPPIPLLLIKAVPTRGEAGVVIFRVPASRSAPHRAADRECYVRRGTASVPVTMREIQDMTLATVRRGEWIAAYMTEARERFGSWLHNSERQVNEAVALRVTAVPAGEPLSLGRLYGHPSRFVSARNFDFATIQNKRHMPVIRPPDSFKAMFRGVRLEYSHPDDPSFIELNSHGGVNLCTLFNSNFTGPCDHLYMPWVAAAVANAAKAIQYMRTLANDPDLEYALEVEIGREPAGVVSLRDWGEDEPIGTFLAPLLINGLSFGPFTERPALVNSILTDLRDAAGANITEPIGFSSIREI